MGGWRGRAAGDTYATFGFFRSCRDFLWTSIKTALRGGAHTSDSRRAFRARARARSPTHGSLPANIPEPPGRRRTSRAPCDHSSREGESLSRPSNARSSPRRGMAARLARALGFTPTQDQVASARWARGPAQARAELYREAAAALAATAPGHDAATRAEFAPSDVRRLEAEQPPSRVACAAEAKTKPDASRRVSTPPPRWQCAPPPSRGRGRVCSRRRACLEARSWPCTAACTCLPCPPSPPGTRTASRW